MGEQRLTDTSTRLTGRKGSVVIDNRDRDPTSLDQKYQVGSLWLNAPDEKAFVLVDDSPVVWKEISSTSGAGTTFQTDSGNASASGGVLQVLGGTGLNTGGATNAVTINLDIPVTVAHGGTGQTSYTNGELLIGNSTGNTLTKATLTAGQGVQVSNGTGTITVAGLDATDSVKGVASFQGADFSIASGAVSLSTDVLKVINADSGSVVGLNHEINIVGGSNVTTSGSSQTLTINAVGSIGGSTGGVDNAVLRADGTAGSTVQSSTATVSDLGELLLNRTSSGRWVGMNDTTDTFGLYNQAGSPEGVVTADIGSICADTASGNLFVKTSDSASTGWNQLASGTFGDVSGPGSSTDNQVARFDGSTGKLIQTSNLRIADNGQMSLNLNAAGLILSVNDGTDLFGIYNSAGTPEGVVTANIGSICTDSSSGKLFVKTSDSANTGWEELQDGNVSGPGSSTDNALARFNGTGGDTLQNSTVIVSDNGEMTNASQPAFSVFFSANQPNVTGDGTVYAPAWDTERFDQNGDYNTGTGVFTAPVDGKYWFQTQIKLNQLGGSNECEMRIVTSNKSYEVYFGHANALATSQVFTFTGGVLADMEAGDTASVTIASKNGGLDNTLLALSSWFQGYLVC